MDYTTNTILYNSTDATTTTAWVLTDDDSSSSRAWMDEELATVHRQQQQQQYSLPTPLPVLERPNTWTFQDEVTAFPLIQKVDSDNSYQRKFGKKRRPSLNKRRGGGSRSQPPIKTNNNTIIYSKPITVDDDDDDNITISTISSASLLIDDRDAVASVRPSVHENNSKSSNRHEYCKSPQRSVNEFVPVVEQMLYQCHITVVEAPPPQKIDTIISSSSSKRTIMSNNNAIVLSSETAAVPPPTTIESSLTTTYESSMLAPPKIRKNRKVVTSKSKKTESSKKKNRSSGGGNNIPNKKSVSFHKYDTIIHTTTNKMELVYSLHYDEIEREKQEYDVVDELENVVNDVGYFFHCLQQSISENVTSKLGTGRSNNKSSSTRKHR